MKTADGFYWIPLLPKELAQKTKGLPRVEWPKEVEKDYRRLHAEFTASKAEFAAWVRKDRDGRMNGTAKVILGYLVDCLNFQTGRCDPSHQTIADEIEVSVRTVERIIPKIAAAGWVEITRRGKTTTNFYRIRVPVEKVAQLLNRVDDLRQQRADAREKHRRRESDPTNMADHSVSDPTFVRSHDPTKMAAHDPTKMADKPLKGTSEGEPLNEKNSTEGSEVSAARARANESVNAYARMKGGF
ncbi:helix-turn-helix domain-containing protein [Mesorhizobium australicum]|uniref:helix-turn-helix domain-containing protein n=1 Tax=Mesorhizobium australicum TaxID=536018 RepID=UPI00333D7D46